MKQKPMLLRIAWASALAVAAMFIPVIPIRIVLAVVAGIIFALSYKKFSVLVIVFLIIGALVIGAGNLFHQLFIPRNWNFGVELFRKFATQEHDWTGSAQNHNGEYTTILAADKEIENAPNLVISVTGAKVIFDREREGIVIPSALTSGKSGSTLTISGNALPSDTLAEIIIGTKAPYQKVRMAVNYLVIDAKKEGLITDRLEIETNFLTAEASVTCGDMQVRTNVLNWNGFLDAKTVVLTAQALSLFLEAQTLERLDMTSQILNAELKYLDEWKGTRTVRVQGTIGAATILKKRNNEGKLNVNQTSQMIGVSIRDY
jgi:hypothetical protein